MFDGLLQLLVLFFVIFDPLLSIGVFVAATKQMKQAEKHRLALLSVGLASLLSFLFLFFGLKVLAVFNTTLDSFQVAGGIVLVMLGLSMVLGKAAQNLDTTEKGAPSGIVAIIATPLLTGPAAITAIILSTGDFGLVTTGTALGIVLAVTAVVFFYADAVFKILGATTVRVLSTIFGLVILSWAVDFIRMGLGF
jgi:multiple antibiotic resistance protein